jgi:hypothetical protein
MVIVAILTVGDDAAFRAFEARAATIMASHGGAIERAIAIPGPPAREVHVIRFATPAAFAAYRADPALAALAPLRARGVTATELLIGDDVQSAPTASSSRP